MKTLVIGLHSRYNPETGHRINFFEYLTDVLNKVAGMPGGAPPEAFRNLLPDRWKKNEQGI